MAASTGLMPVLHGALLDAFNLADLDRMMRYELDRDREHYSTANGLIRIVDDILQVAAQEGWLLPLMEGAARFQTTNARLQDALAQLRAAAAPPAGRRRSTTAAFASDSFSIAGIARETALGGSLGWAIAGLAFGLLSWESNGAGGALLGILAGLFSGYLGGGAAGLLTGAVVRRVAPRFARGQLRRLGFAWALATMASLLIGGFIGVQVAPAVIDSAVVSDVSSAGTIEDAIGQICGAALAAMVIALMTVVLTSLAGLVAGSGVIGWVIGRQLRLAAGGISRRQAFGIGLGWMAAAIATLLLLILLLSAFLS